MPRGAANRPVSGERKPRTPKQRWFVLLVDILGFEEFQTANHTAPGGDKYDAKTVAAAEWAAASGLDEGRVLGWADELGKAFPKAQRVDKWVLLRRLAELDFGPEGTCTALATLDRHLGQVDSAQEAISRLEWSIRAGVGIDDGLGVYVAWLDKQGLGAKREGLAAVAGANAHGDYLPIEDVEALHQLCGRDWRLT